MSETPKRRGRPSADGTRAPQTADEAIANECLRLRLKSIPHEGTRAGLTPAQVLAVIKREPRNGLERKARALLGPHPSAGGLAGANRGGRARQVAELAAYWMMAPDGLKQEEAIAQARAMYRKIPPHGLTPRADLDALNVRRELMRITGQIKRTVKTSVTVVKAGRVKRPKGTLILSTVVSDTEILFSVLP